MRLGLRTHQKATKSLNRLSKTPLKVDFLMAVNCCCVAGQRQRERAKTLIYNQFNTQDPASQVCCSRSFSKLI